VFESIDHQCVFTKKHAFSFSGQQRPPIPPQQQTRAPEHDRFPDIAPRSDRETTVFCRNILIKNPKIKTSADL